MSGKRVSVSGHYRSNGTYVKGYTRSAPSRSSSCSSSVSSSRGSTSSRSSSGGTVSVSGYYRSNGTYVSGYTRAAPSSRGSVHSDSSRSSSSPGTVKVSGYYRSNGTYVEPYTRLAPISRGSDCTKVSCSYQSRSAPKLKGNVSTSSAGSKCYTDNALNRRLGRVGKPIGTHVLHEDGSVTTSCKSGRGINRRRLEQSHTVEELRRALRNLGFGHPTTPTATYDDYQNALYSLEREEVQERWSKRGITPSTDVQALNASCISRPEKFIPYSELHLNEELIGRGGFGEVYAGLWHGIPIAYKQLLLQRLSKKRKQSFEIEVTVLSTLENPNTVKMFGVVTEEGHCGIVMEYLVRTIYQAVFVDENEFTTEKKKQIVNQIASGLAYLHTSGSKENIIAHRDLKSANVLLDRGDNAKLADFGLSALKNATESSRSEAVPGCQGTPRYSAPEVLRGEILSIKQHLQADIYSLGVTVFEIMVEKEVYEDLSLRQLEANVGRGTMRPSTDMLSRPVAQLLSGCWNGDAKYRPTAKNFLEEWGSIRDVTFHRTY